MLCQIQQISYDTVAYFGIFKQNHREPHLCFSSAEKQAVGFHWERKRAALGQETQTDFPGGKPY